MTEHAQAGMRRRGRLWYVSCSCGTPIRPRRAAWLALLSWRRHRNMAAARYPAPGRAAMNAQRLKADR